MSDIGNEIKAYRGRHLINQTEMARRCGVTLQTINSIERGQQTPSLLTEAKIRKVLDEDKVEKED